MILITGGGGFLGVNIARALLDKGQEVLLLQRHPVRPPSFLASFWGKQAKCAIGNVLDLPFLLGLAKEYHVDSIIHAAFDNDSLLNREGPMSAHLYQFVQVPVQGCINLMEVARLHNIRRLTLDQFPVAYTGAPGGRRPVAGGCPAPSSFVFSYREPEEGSRADLFPLLIDLRPQLRESPGRMGLRSGQLSQ